MKNNSESFWIRLKNDRKFKVKIELITGFGLIFILLIYANITGVGDNYNYNNNTTTDDVDLSEKKENYSLLDIINNNYNYECSVSLVKYIDENREDIINRNITYSGTVNMDKEIISKDNDLMYYREGDNYYLNSKSEVVTKEVIYDMFDYKLINLNEIKNYIKLGMLDHTTTYSNGDVTYAYNVLVSDVINSYKGNDKFNIDVDIKDNVLVIVIDYSNYIKEIDNSFKELKVEIEYTNINDADDIVLK